MKVKMELDLDVQMGVGSLNGTGCQGYLPKGTTYDDIVRVFGGPQMTSSLDGKIQVEWYGRINGLQFTIYDYKSSVEPERNTDWHIGGNYKFVAELVKLYLIEYKI
ncbi:hypothetical protein M0R36_04315 [bacterium]|nr:hypothetical protein [bacterium]